MPEKIFTIPINEAFDMYEGCPLCRLKDRLEEQMLGFSLGEAMMEPGVREEMNELGFCPRHFEGLYSMKNKLTLGLILESHLDKARACFETEASGGKRPLFGRDKREAEDAADAMGRHAMSCYICSRISRTEARYYSNVIYLWESDPGFREKLKKQPFFCVTHFSGLLCQAKSCMRREGYLELYAAMAGINGAYFKRLREAVTGFCVSFDHRNSGKPLTEDERKSIERAIAALK